MISSFVDFRQEMLEKARAGGLDVMPHLITSSTRATSADLHQTVSTRSRVGEVQLRPLTTQEAAFSD